MEEELKDILENGKDWEKAKTTIPGLWICKMPGKGNNPPTLAIIINPVDSSGKATKKHDIYVRSKSELDDIKELFCGKKLDEIMDSIENINPHSEQTERVLKI